MIVFSISNRNICPGRSRETLSEVSLLNTKTKIVLGTSNSTRIYIKTSRQKLSITYIFSLNNIFFLNLQA